MFGDDVGRPRRTIKKAWRLALTRAQIDGLHFHDLRREAASRWLDAGRSLSTIQRWLGHHSLAQTVTYLCASQGNDAEEMRAYEERIGRLPYVAVSAGSNGFSGDRSDDPCREKTQENAIVH